MSLANQIIYNIIKPIPGSNHSRLPTSPRSKPCHTKVANSGPKADTIKRWQRATKPHLDNQHSLFNIQANIPLHYSYHCWKCPPAKPSETKKLQVLTILWSLIQINLIAPKSCWVTNSVIIICNIHVRSNKNLLLISGLKPRSLSVYCPLICLKPSAFGNTAYSSQCVYNRCPSSSHSLNFRNLSIMLLGGIKPVRSIFGTAHSQSGFICRTHSRWYYS